MLRRSFLALLGVSPALPSIAKSFIEEDIVKEEDIVINTDQDIHLDGDVRLLKIHCNPYPDARYYEISIKYGHTEKVRVCSDTLNYTFNVKAKTNYEIKTYAMDAYGNKYPVSHSHMYIA